METGNLAWKTLLKSSEQAGPGDGCSDCTAKVFPVLKELPHHTHQMAENESQDTE
jgi:hypothetical protein